MTRAEARDAIQTGFRRTVDRDVSRLAYDQLLIEGHVQAAERCQRSHEVISERLWSQFSFDWSQVFFNPGGTAGKASVFLQSKAALTYEWALAGEYNEEVNALEAQTLETLSDLWTEWAGYMLTSQPELEAALD